MIGLISPCDVYNYGSQLVSCALQTMIEDMGLPCEHILYIRKHDAHYIWSLPFKAINGPLYVHKHELAVKLRQTALNEERAHAMEARKAAFDTFVTSNMKRSHPYCGYAALKKSVLDYKGIILGSDQVWHPMNLESGFTNMAFVREDIPKIVYGASFGVGEIPFYQRLRTRRYLGRIRHISVREKQGAVLIERLTGRKVPDVLDPTLMVRMEQWEKVFDDQFVPDKPYIFAYFLGNQAEHRQRVKTLKEQMGLDVIAIDSYNIVDCNYIDKRADEAGPGAFVSLIRNASFVCTDSFHGSVFSILNHRPFITFRRYAVDSKMSGNSRVESLLSQLSLEDRLYAPGRFERQSVEMIDYEAVDKKLECLRDVSKCYLINALKEEKLL